MPDPYRRLYPEAAAGGFSRVDGTVDFYTRVAALLRPDMVVVDFGAGRGAFLDQEPGYRRDLQNLQGRVAKLIGVDIDPVVENHPALDESIVYAPGEAIPLRDQSVNLIVSDFTFEHIEDPGQVASELTRILRPGGWICARTPNRYGYIALAARMVPNRMHTRILARVQPARLGQDVFPTFYRLNTPRQLRTFFPPSGFELLTYTVNSEAAYFGNSLVAWRAVHDISKLLPEALGAQLMVFIRKRS